MALASTTEPRRIDSEIYFRGKEWCKLDYAAVPSPEIIEEEAALIREENYDRDHSERSEDFWSTVLNEDAMLPAAMIQRAVEDVETFARTLRETPNHRDLSKRASLALKALGWLFCESTTGPDHFSFEEACTLAEVGDHESMREKILNNLSLDKDVLQALTFYCNS